MRNDKVPGAALATGPLAKALRTNGMFQAAVDEAGNFVYRLRDEPLPITDSAAAAQPFLRGGWAAVSVTVNPEDLHDPDTGIFANYEQRWEVPAQLSYFDGKELIRKMDVGMRLHGNSTRRPEVRAKYGASVRLYTRANYGGGELPLQSIFDGQATAASRLVIRGESALSSALSFDIVREVGGDAPRMRPALYVLNGELQGVFSLSEHLTKDYWTEHLGHSDFSFYRYRGNNSKADSSNYEDLHAWVARLKPGEVTMAKVSENVDLESYIRHMFPFLWCGTDDWAQGAAYLNRGPQHQLWRWVNWDMDRSFRFSNEQDPENTEVWNKMCFDLILADLSNDPRAPQELKEANRVQREDVRSLVFAGLVRDDPMFRKLFAERAMGFMNHELNKGFLKRRFAYYRQFGGEGGISKRALQNAELFLRKRADFFREDMARVFGLDESFPVRVAAGATSEEQELIIDGRLEALPYLGYYFPGQTISVEAKAVGEKGATRVWRMAGARVESPLLELEVQEELEIRVLRHSQRE
ncbi:MAG: CotH kinase family protein [Planctomycetota bacterium]|nr:CotH kinase family protein [Planctomycetota bacterium]MDG2142709.1 CotH kinase family protein [Planctomycetota bacterium]